MTIHWSDPLALVLLGASLLVIGLILARAAKRKRERGTGVRKL
ncbi:MAG: hypothetical protein ACREK9_13910 [Candidatus Rokuibacteriota bacterium]